MGKAKKSNRNESPDGPLKNDPAYQIHPTRAELLAMGKTLRDKCPRAAHAVWQPPSNRPDPVELLVQSSQGRIPQLIPIRYGRMMQTPFTFYRSESESA